MHYWQLDVFAEQPLSGNGLAVFPDARGLTPATMQALTRELRQFESIFLCPGEQPNQFSARVFTVEEELPFAGHPVLGAAALLHHLYAGEQAADWQLQLPEKTLSIATRHSGQGFYAQMNQGRASFGAVLSEQQAEWFAACFASSLDRRYPAQVVSTGLPYLLLPVTAAGLANAKQQQALDAALDELGAAFVFLMDVDAAEGRTWDPLGVIEDIATGSAAGPVAAWRLAQGLQRAGQNFQLYQGRFVGRPSRLDVQVQNNGQVLVGGHVQLVARAELLLTPASMA